MHNAVELAKPQLRFKEFSEDWEERYLKDIIKIKSGLGFKANEYTTTKEIKLLQIENVGYGAVRWTSNTNFLPTSYLETHKNLVLKENDIVLALNRPITNNKLKIAKLSKKDTPSILYQRVGKIILIDENTLDSFIYQHFHLYLKSYVLKSSIGSDQPFISITNLYKQVIKIPSIKEQIKIAKLLSIVDEKIKQTTQIYELLNEYKKGIIQKIFNQELQFKDDKDKKFHSWEEKKLGETTNYFKGYAFKSDDYKDEGVRIVRVSDLSADNIKNVGTFTFISKHLSSEYEKYKIKADDIIITTVGSKPEMRESAVGRPIYINTNDNGLLNQNLLILRSNTKSISGFIFPQLLSSRYYSHIISIQRGNANQSNITVKDLNDFKVKLADINEQTKISKFLTAIDEKIDNTSKKLKLAKEWKKGLLQQMFV